jgi:hypothetical protein
MRKEFALLCGLYCITSIAEAAPNLDGRQVGSGYVMFVSNGDNRSYSCHVTITYHFTIDGSQGSETRNFDFVVSANQRTYRAIDSNPKSAWSKVTVTTDSSSCK